MTVSNEYLDLTVGTGFHQFANFGQNFIVSGDTSTAFQPRFLSSMQDGATIGIVPPTTPTTPVRLMFYVRVLPQEICPTAASNPQCAAGQAPEIYMKLFFNPQAVRIADADKPKGIEHDTVCTSGAAPIVTHCLGYGAATDPLLVNSI
jgi:hypothetical protein